MTRPVAVVTGGAGFIGSHLTDALVARGYSVRIIDNLTGGHLDNVKQHLDDGTARLFESDILELEPSHEAFRESSYVFHLAGIGDIVPSIERPAEYMDVNVQGTVRVLEAARANQVKKVVYAASSSCYGLAATPTTEDHPIDPRYPYALSKYLGEQAAAHWSHVYKLPVNSIRIFNAYGPRVRTTGAYGAVFGVFFKQKLAGQPLTVVGDGTQRRDFVHVFDVAEAFCRAAETSLSGRVWNCGADNPRSVNELVEVIGGDVVYIPKRPGEPDCTWADTTRIRADLQWKPSMDFRDGVRGMLNDINRWSDAPLWTTDSIAKATKTWFTTLGGDA